MCDDLAADPAVALHPREHAVDLLVGRGPEEPDRLVEAAGELEPGGGALAERDEEGVFEGHGVILPGLCNKLQAGIVQDTPRGYAVRMDASWRVAAIATLHCLTGCAIGEVLGMVLSTWWGWGLGASVALSIGLAFFFGYLLTFTSVRRSGADVPSAVRLALASDTVSIATMELVDNGFLILVPGAMVAGLTDALFWVSLVASLVVAFVVTVPVNRWLISRGRGHAVVHQMHGSHH